MEKVTNLRCVYLMETLSFIFPLLTRVSKCPCPHKVLGTLGEHRIFSSSMGGHMGGISVV